MNNNKNGDKFVDVVSTDKTTSSWNKPVTRRAFLSVVSVGVAGTILVASGGKERVVKREVFAANAKGMVIGDPTRCVGCRRC